ncbi:MAG TPA: hypothetical protein VHN58_10000 [Croceicoccus sp.]|nr:hypothetical protein [Croceicoccus sp.]
MTGPTPIKLPAGYAPGIALGFAASDTDDTLALVTPERPLPVSLSSDLSVQVVSEPPPAAATAIAGTRSTDGRVGPFAPTANLPVVLTLSGTWDGTATLLRSTDGGVTTTALTAGGMPWGVFAANACEPVWVETEANATLYLDIALTSGTLAYRFAQ